MKQKVQSIAKLQKDSASLEELLRQTSHRTMELEEELNTLRGEKANLIAGLTELQREVRLASERTSGIDVQTNCDLQSRAFEAELMRLKEEIKSKDHKIVELEAHLAEMHEKFISFEVVLEARDNTIAELEKDRQSLKESEEKCVKLLEDAEKKNHENSKLVARVAEIDATLNQLCFEQDRNQQTIESLKKMIQTKDTDIQRLRSGLNAEKAQVFKLRSENDELRRNKGIISGEESWERSNLEFSDIGKENSNSRFKKFSTADKDLIVGRERNSNLSIESETGPAIRSQLSQFLSQAIGDNKLRQMASKLG
eukprot:TRINITY_DN9999_c0_g1_i3.p1 TRINITY_DN9999_c0_g1~~TRINITY_DN9999_c0_g1_i3.p1  ORF type:complete len:311 (-),score=92.17 TRINITY_DN9999_c0_g1_i3:69-1001(-)